MVLKRITIEEQRYPCIISNGKIDIDDMKRRNFPREVLEYYEHMSKDDLAPELLQDPRHWYGLGIDHEINQFLAKNKITKKQLHSIETRRDNTGLGLPPTAIIIYEE